MGVYCENFVMIGLTVDAGDHFKKWAAIPLAPCIYCMFTLGRGKVREKVEGKQYTRGVENNNMTVSPIYKLY